MFITNNAVSGRGINFLNVVFAKTLPFFFFFAEKMGGTFAVQKYLIIFSAKIIAAIEFVSTVQLYESLINDFVIKLTML